MSHVLFFDDAQEFLRALHNTALFMDEGSVRELKGVRFEYVDEVVSRRARLTLVATDRLQLAFQMMPVRITWGDGAMEFTLEKDEIKVLLSKHRGATSDLMLVISANTLKVESSKATTVHGFLPQMTYLKWRGLLPKSDKFAATGHITFPASFLARIGKLKLPKDGGMTRMEFCGARKPALMQVAGGPTLLVLPVKTD